MGERLENAFADIRAGIAAAKAERDKAGLIAATIRVNAMRLGATDAEIDAMVRGETNFVNFMVSKIDQLARGEALLALLRRAHDAIKAMPDDYRGHEQFDGQIDQLVADMAKELGVGNG